MNKAFFPAKGQDGATTCASKLGAREVLPGWPGPKRPPHELIPPGNLLTKALWPPPSRDFQVCDRALASHAAVGHHLEGRGGMERKPSVVKLVSWGASMVSLERGCFGSNRCEHKAGTTDTGRARGASISRTLNSCLFFRSSTFEKLGMSELGKSTRRMLLLSNAYSSAAPTSQRFLSSPSAQSPAIQRQLFHIFPWQQA